MKKFIALIMAVALTVSLSACGKNTPTADKNKIQIVATIFPLYDFARQIAGDRAEVTLLLPTGAEVHSYEPTPQDIIKIKESDLFIHLGMDADPWTDAVINDADSNNLNVVSAIRCVDPMMEQKAHNGSLVGIDPHVWTSPENAEEIAEAIKDALCRIDSANRGYYDRNEERYSDKLSALDERFERLTEGKRPFIVFADSFPFRYLSEEYDIRYFSAFPGCSSESEPSAATVSELIETVKQRKIPMVFYTETSNQQLADTVCEETGAGKQLFHSCHTVTEEELRSGVTYLDLMERNLEALKKAI